MKCSLNIQHTKGAVNPVWSFGFNTCHAPLWLRADLPQQCADVCRDFGFRYVRFHDTFSDRLNICHIDEAGNITMDFTHYDEVFDKIIAGGFLPFFEIGFIPTDLQAKVLKEPQNYEESFGKIERGLVADYVVKNEIRDYELWSEVIRLLIRHIIERYGLESAKQWYYEVWNEPDLFFKGDMETYLKIYDYTVLAVKSVCPDLRVGGPATSKCLWVDEFIDHICKGSEVNGFQRLPCDFISTHAYPTDQKYIPAVLDGVKTSYANLLSLMFHHARKTIDASPLKGTPFFMGEWNSSAGPMAWNHDEKNNGAFILKTLNDVRDCIDGSLYWTLSDIYEELGLHYIPFHGGYGIINVNDIPKSSWHAFNMLSKLSGDELVLEDAAFETNCGALATFDAAQRKIDLVVYHYQAPDEAISPAHPYTFTFSGLPVETVRVQTEAVTDRSGSAYEWWMKAGSPEYLNQKLLTYLLEKAKPEETNGILRSENGVFTVTGALGSGDCMHLRITY